MDYRELYNEWLTNPYFDDNTKKELEAIENDDKEIEDRFYKELEFGTAGLRGVIGAGTNRMNIYTVRKATQGLANYIIKMHGEDKGVAIAYDSRHMSPEFADEAALCLNANGIKAYVFDSLRPTPELSFAVRELKCIAGINVTASHNPAEYNGYKVYWEDGAQITPPHDVGIMDAVAALKDYNKVKTMDKDQAVADGLYIQIGKEVDDKYIEILKTQVETLLQNMAKVLANNTNYATMVSSPKSQGNKIKFIQLSVLEEKQLLCTVVSDKNHVVNKIVNVDRVVSQEMIVRLNVALNTALAGLALEEINLGVISALTSQAGEYEDLVNEVLKAITEAISTEEQMKIYTSGATNIFKYPELSDKERASQLLTTLEEKSQLTELINESDEETGIQVYIGNESPVQSMKDCSVVTATYELEDGFKGTIGIIGPKRMDYEKVVETLRVVKEQLNENFNDKE